MAVAKDNNAAKEQEDLKLVNGNVTTTLKYSGEKPQTPILDTINYPVHMKNLSVQVKFNELV